MTAIWVTELRSRDGAIRSLPAVAGQARRRSVRAKTVTAAAARTVLDKMVAEGGDPAEIAEREGLTAMEDSGELEAIVAKVIAENPDVVERIQGGNAKAMGALVGPIMRETKGRADGGEVNRLLREQLGVSARPTRAETIGALTAASAVRRGGPAATWLSCRRYLVRGGSSPSMRSSSRRGTAAARTARPAELLRRPRHVMPWQDHSATALPQARPVRPSARRRAQLRSR